jgi:hypothetical protein
VALMVAIVVLLLRQLPPLTPSIMVAVLPTHTDVSPLMVPADGVVFTVTVVVVVAVPQLLVTE